MWAGLQYVRTEDLWDIRMVYQHRHKPRKPNAADCRATAWHPKLVTDCSAAAWPQTAVDSCSAAWPQNKSQMTAVLQPGLQANCS